ncbi:MAG TPA: hypothetical protein H9755_00300 [Candidatus Dietzia intestinigallinarum]|nr:hypothetical protein [Candidatus Dietzia intestinigallinarum]
MDGSGPARPGTGGAGSGPPQGVIAAVVVLVALVVIGVAVVIGVRLGDVRLGERTATGSVSSSTEATTSRTPPRPRTTSATTDATTPRRASAVCDARRINADLGFPDSGSRIIDCGSGWAVMAGEHSGDPYWVSFRDGRWQTEPDISIYLFTCPDEAIARGAPAWMADRHLTTCSSLTRHEPSTRSSARPPAPRPGESSGVRPTPTGPEVSPSPSEPPSTSVSSSSGVTTTTTTPPPQTPNAGAGEDE